MRRFVTALCVFGLVAGFSGLAMGVPYKNPGHSYKMGDFSAGFIFESASRDLSSDRFDPIPLEAEITLLMGAFGIGLGPGGMLEVHVGTAKTGLKVGGDKQPDSDGTIIGASFRYNIQTIGSLSHGPFASVHSGSVDNDTSETTFTQVDGGYGVGFALNDVISFYGGGVLSVLSGTVDEYSQATDFDGKDEVSGFAGLEIHPAEQLLIGIEGHAIAETSFLVYLDGRF